MTDFIKPVKSTLDFIGASIGSSYIGGAVAVIDMTDNVNVEELMASPDPAILWELISLGEAPRRPLWNVSFLIGAKTSKDAAQYEQMSLLEAVNDIIRVGSDIPVHDYSGAAAGTRVGLIHVTSVDLDPAQGDRFFGMRLIAVRGKAMSF